MSVQGIFATEARDQGKSARTRARLGCGCQRVVSVVAFRIAGDIARKLKVSAALVGLAKGSD